MQALVGIDDTRQQTPRGGVHPQVGRRRAADDDRRHGEIERGKHLVALSFEHSKGLEFKLVVLVGYDRKAWTVQPFWLTDSGDRAEFRALEQRKLFVAMTRARDRLALVASPPLANRLTQARGRCDEWDWTV
jgi:superfamily I DNA/RNA helicase